jgi:outer membrane protein assembly factor BamB
MYGVNVRRTGVARETRVRPPFRIARVFQAGSLIEFPPIIANGHLYFGTNGGRFVALSRDRLAIRWEHDFGRCIASSPAFSSGFVYAALMDPSPCVPHDESAPGFLVAMQAATGRIVWRFRAGPIESSPLVVDGLVYVGSWDGHVYALDHRDGNEVWRFTTEDKVKGAAAYSHGRIYIGSYDGHLYALDARSGRLRFSVMLGEIYATPVVEAGRIFVGTLDGAVFALDAATGRKLWGIRTGSYVYASASVWHDSVLIGSYDGRFYALDEATGRVRWSFSAGGPISGSATVVDDVVYFATCAICIAHATRAGQERTFGLDARTGRLLWTFPDGDYTPMVAADREAYLVGYDRLFALAPAP